MNTDNDRSPLQIGISIAIGIVSSLIITYVFGINLDIIAKLVISITPSVVVSFWAIRERRISSMRLWGIISHSIVYGLINFVAVELFSGFVGIL